MKVHEYQAKQLFAEYGIPVPEGDVATTPAEVAEIAGRVGRPVMIKAQVHVGGRGKAGGVKYAADPASAEQIAGNILGMDIKGLTVNKVLVTVAEDIVSEAYLAIILDRSTQRPVIMVSTEGGVDIEDVAAKTPEKIHKLPVDPTVGLRPYQARNLAQALYHPPDLVRQATDIIMKMYRLFWELDASLAEINPLVTNSRGEIVALDAKVTVDDNSLYRQGRIAAMRDLDAEEPSEVAARDADLSYVKLDGTIGCIVNGAGLAMATMDLVKRHGGEPANFLDIGGSSNPQKVVSAMQIILSDPKVQAILINIFGGITRCDDVANGLVAAFKILQPTVPVVIRLVGTNEKEAAAILADMHLPCANTLDEAVMKAIQLAKVPVTAH
jgi:succinyl-CoA synthetase beta subunit